MKDSIKYKSIVSRFRIFKHDVEGMNKVVRLFMSDLHRKFEMVRDAVIGCKLTAEEPCRHVIFGGDRVEVSCLGGPEIHTSDKDTYARLSKSSKAQASYTCNGFTFFRNFNPSALYKLQRYGRGKRAYGNHSTFVKPFICYLQTLKAVKNTEPTCDLLVVIGRYVEELTKLVSDNGWFYVVDDVVRQFLAEVDKLTFVICQKDNACSLVFTSLHGLATMGGPRGWTKESVFDNLKDWVAEEKKFPYEDDDFIKGKLIRWLDEWTSQVSRDEDALTFSEFVSDPMRWATGGGAKKATMNINNVEVVGRSKWFWALANLAKGEDLYERSLAEGSDANVALKEEVKTRCVITTPQSSYLRQCYMLYRLGTPKFLKSTLSDPQLVNNITTTHKGFFVCIDSSSFDHTVTKAWIIGVLRSLSERTSGELRDIIEQEIEAISNMSVIFDKVKIPYKNGLLSGWRLTSVLGSLLSALVCEYINNKLQINLDYIVQGDDIIMLSPRMLSPERILEACASFGITTNEKKTTIGKYGEFLKYRYGMGKVQGYAARSVRSIFYANPWLDTSVVVKASEVTGKWWSMLSRIMVTHNGLFLSKSSEATFRRKVVDDVFGWLGNNVSKKVLDKCINTPVSLGGLGVYEYSECDKTGNILNVKVNELKETFETGSEKLVNMFIPSKKRVVLTSKDVSVKVKNNNFFKDLYRVKAEYYKTVNSVGRVKFELGTNIFRTIMTEIAKCKNYPPLVDALSRTLSGKIGVVVRPRYLAKANRWADIAGWLLGKTVDGVTPPSLFVDTRYDTELVTTVSNISSTMFNNLPNVTAATSRLISVFAYHLFKLSRCVLHAL